MSWASAWINWLAAFSCRAPVQRNGRSRWGSWCLAATFDALLTTWHPRRPARAFGAAAFTRSL
eukprot:2247827-Lingulodinium_polyedra.AAC.1